jgi:hypothetical protein
MSFSFVASKAKSDRSATRKEWEVVYRGYAEQTGKDLWDLSLPITDISLDKLGVDRICWFKDGKTELYDEKNDHWNTPNFVIEWYSNLESGKLGWTLDSTKITHVVAYMRWKQSGCWFVKAKELRKLAEKRVEQWSKVHKVVDCDNKSYTTRNVMVPLDVLQEDLEMIWVSSK